MRVLRNLNGRGKREASEGRALLAFQSAPGKGSEDCQSERNGGDLGQCPS